MSNNVKQDVANLAADNADLRATVSALAEQLSSVISSIASVDSTVATLARAALDRKPRATRGAKGTGVITVSETERVRAAGGFKAKHRFALLEQLVIAGPGEHLLGDLCARAFLPGYNPKSAIPLADAIARRCARKPQIGYTLIVDTDEDDAAQTVLVFARRGETDETVETNEDDTAETGE